MAQLKEDATTRVPAPQVGDNHTFFYFLSWLQIMLAALSKARRAVTTMESKLRASVRSFALRGSALLERQHARAPCALHLL